MKNYLEFRKNRWYVRLAIPEDLRDCYNGKLRLFKSTGTSDKQEAHLIALKQIAKWKDEFQDFRVEKRTSEQNKIEHEESLAIQNALAIRSQLEDASQRDAVNLNDLNPWEQESALLSVAIADIAERERDRGNSHFSSTLHKITLRGDTPIRPFVDDWKAQLPNDQRTIDQRLRDIEHLLSAFPVVQSITVTSARQWINELRQPIEQGGKGRTPHSIKRILIGARQLWSYLQDIGQAPHEIEPFKLPSNIKREVVKNTGDGWVAFTPEESVMIYKVVQEKVQKAKSGSITQKKAQDLLDLIKLGMYTGARIEELCSLKRDDCINGVLDIRVSKTKAGIRKIPIHHDIQPLVERLLNKSKDDYLMSGLSRANQYNKGSNGIGKRFSHLKTALGFGEYHVFHSFRGTLSTLMVREGADILLVSETVGHETEFFTKKKYAKNAFTIDQKREAINRISYPW